MAHVSIVRFVQLANLLMKLVGTRHVMSARRADMCHGLVTIRVIIARLVSIRRRTHTVIVTSVRRGNGQVQIYLTMAKLLAS